MAHSLLHDSRLTVDGRTVAYTVLGDPAGAPVLWHHPTPSSRLEFVNPEEGPALAAAGLRLVSVDRPGYGASDPLPGRTVADAGRDALAVLDALELDAVVNVGFSGGGPSALAVAALAPDRVVATTVIAGDGPAESLPDPSTAAPATAALFRVRTEADAYAALAAGYGIPDARAVDADRFLEIRRMQPRTRARLADPDTRRRLTEPARQGLVGMASDFVSGKSDWGFDLAAVGGDVTLHYGTADTVCPPEIGRWLADRIDTAHLVLVDADHAALGERLVEIIGSGRDGS